MEMLSNVTVWRFDDMLRSTSGLESHLSMSLIHVVYVVLLLTMEALVSSMSVLVLENLCEDSFSILIGLSSLDVHTSSMHSIELIFDIS
jgi:hypothetical protein